MVKRRADYGVVLFFAYPIHAGSASKVSRVGVGAQVFSFNFRTTVFHPTQLFSVSLHSFSGLPSSYILQSVFQHERKRKKEGAHAAGYVNYA